MSRVFWDTMLFIYLMEDHPQFADRVRDLLARMRKRGDSLFTSHLAIGELMAGADPSRRPAIYSMLDEMNVTLLPFADRAVAPFSDLRGHRKIKVADAIQLACAASVGMDLFLTGDKQLMKLDVPGIQFIADFNASIL